MLAWLIYVSQPLIYIRLSTYLPELTGKSKLGLDCFGFARHYSRNRWLLSILRPTKMFQFRHLSLSTLFNSGKSTATLLAVGFPIRKSSDQSLLATPRSLSQPTTSFIDNLRQGIRYMRLCSFL